MGMFESEEYAPDAVPVSHEDVGEVHEVINDMMSDSLMNTGGDNLESFNTESHGMNREGDASNLDDFIGAHSEDFRDVSSLSIADYQGWLFEADEASELAVARIVSNFKASGFEVKPTFATLAATTWSRANYGGEDRATALYVVRKAESQATDYKAEIIAELRAEYEAESSRSFSKYTKPAAIAVASVLGLGFLWRLK